MEYLFMPQLDQKFSVYIYLFDDFTIVRFIKAQIVIIYFDFLFWLF